MILEMDSIHCGLVTETVTVTVVVTVVRVSVTAVITVIINCSKAFSGFDFDCFIPKYYNFFELKMAPFNTWVAWRIMFA